MIGKEFKGHREVQLQLDKVKAPVDLNKIYAPIKKDLSRVEAIVNSAGLNTFPPLAQQLFQNAKKNEDIARLLAYSLDGGGKKLRPALVLLSGKLFEYELEPLLQIATAVEILHTATLVHDDIIDKSALRRGKPTINAMWDADKAILIGDFLFAESLEFASRAENQRVTKMFIEAIVSLCAGELSEHFNTFNTVQTYEHYVNTIAAKTAALFSLATGAGAVLGGAAGGEVNALRNYGYNLGLAFQIIDDILDFTGDEVEMGKPRGSDLAQGIMTLPAMFLMERYPRDNPLTNLSESRNNKEKIDQAVKIIMEDSSIINDCYAEAARYAERAARELEFLPGSASYDSLIELTGYIIRRNK